MGSLDHVSAACSRLSSLTAAAACGALAGSSAPSIRTHRVHEAKGLTCTTAIGLSWHMLCRAQGNEDDIDECLGLQFIVVTSHCAGCLAVTRHLV